MNREESARLKRTKLPAALLMAVILMLAAQVTNGQEDFFDRTHNPTGALDSLTQTERAWLREHPVIRVAQDPGWPPIEFDDKHGRPSGMSRDYMNIVEKRLGVKFEWVRNLSWQEAYDRMKRREIDMTTSVAITPERSEFWDFTKPYMTIPIVIVTGTDVTYIDNMRELAGKKVAVVDGYAVSDWIPRDFPEIQLVKVKNVRDGFEALKRNEVFAYIENMLVAGHHISKQRPITFKIVGGTPYTNVQRMAVRKDWAVLSGILDKALESITETDRNRIYRKWLPLRYERGFDYIFVWKIIAGFIFILLGCAAWIWKLRMVIAGRKKAEADSGKNERRFQTLFKAAPMPLALINENGSIADFNDQATETFGYNREDIPTINEWWQHAYPDPDYRSRAMKTWGDDLRRAKENNADTEPRDYEVTCKNGSVCIVEVAGTFLGDDLLISFFDVTGRNAASAEQRWLFESAQRARQAMLSILEDQKRAQETLRESEVKLRLILDGTPFPVALVDAAGQEIEYWSRSAAVLFGHTASTASEWYKLAYPDPVYRHEVMGRFAAVLEKARLSGKTVNAGEYQITCHDRSVRICEMHAIFVKDKLIVTFNDVTERCRMEGELKESKALIDTVVENIPIMIFLKEAKDLRFVMLNRAGEELLGHDRKDLIGKSDQDLFPPEQAGHFIDKDRKVIDEGGMLDIAEEPILTAKKGQRVLHTRKVCIQGADGQTKYLLGVSDDITERKKAEDQLQQSIKDLKAFHEATLDRENRMIELKAEVNKLAKELGRPAPHDLSFLGEH